MRNDIQISMIALAVIYGLIAIIFIPLSIYFLRRSKVGGLWWAISFAAFTLMFVAFELGLAELL